MKIIALLDDIGKTYLVKPGEGLKKIRGLGFFDTDGLEKNIGRKLKVENKWVWVLEPSIEDKIHGMKRVPQIILPKDSAYIIICCNIHPGSKVVEAGAGSGAMTMVLANAVGDEGRVISYEKRGEFARVASKNIKNAGFESRVEIRVRDFSELEEEGIDSIDSVVMDLPDPWEYIEVCWSRLKISGHIASYLPTISQVEKLYRALRAERFIGIRTVELFEREILVRENKIRPSSKMVAHTGYLTFARKCIEV